MSSVFGIEPNAVIISAMARYDNADAFNQTACEAGSRNIGSRMQPIVYDEACTCSEEEE
jgi:hypothetical protein